jgi:PAS domain S-box-containing protein
MHFEKRRILVVGSDTEWRAAVMTALASQGYELEEMDAAEELLLAATKSAYDLIVVPLAYPELEGWRVCRLLRTARDPNRRPSPVLLFSDSVAGEEAQLLTASFGGHLVRLPARTAPEWRQAVVEATGRHLNHTGAVNLATNATGAAMRRNYLIAEQSRTVYWELDANGLYTYVSHLAAAVWGYTPVELVGKLHFYDLHPAEEREAFRRTITASMVNRASFRNFKNPIERKDGEVILVLTSALPITGAEGQLTGYHGCDTEVTEWHRAEEELLRERRRLMSVIEGTNAGTWEWDIRTGEAIFNERWAEIAGYTLPELEPVSIRTWAGMAHPEDLSASNEALLRHFAGESRHYDAECRMRHKDGSWVWVHDRGKVVEWDAAGRPLRMAGTHIDISARKQAELALAASRDAAEAATRAKSEFLSTMSHEIRTPMNAIIGMCGLLLESHLRRDQEDFARIIRSSADTLLSLINDVLDFSRIEAGRMDVDQKPFDLQRTVEEAAGLVALEAVEKGLELAVRFPPSLGRLYIGDAARLRQVVLNLLNNAVKFADRGHVLLSVAADGEQLAITVEDSGPGIAADRHEEVFAAFTRLDSSSTRRHGGAGLGLAISRRLARLMGGDIELDSAPGHGSRFTLRLGLTPLPDPVHHVSPAALTGLRVLVAEPLALTRGILAGWCRHWGMRVDEASDCTPLAKAMDDPYRVCLAGGSLYPVPSPGGTRLVRVATHNHPVEPEPGVEVLYRPVCAGELRAALESVLIPERAVGKEPAMTGEVRVAEAGTRVLLVEDNAVNRRLGELLLSRMGCRVEIAENGARAVEMAAREDYDLIFMDCQMPEVDGFQATASIRAMAAPHGDVPIIALTAEAMSGDREKCLIAGMDDYLTKPIVADTLRGRVALWTGRRHASPAPV